MDQTLKQPSASAIHLEDVHVTLPSRAGPVAILRGLDMSVAAG
jgi:putative ABC transport system ATP-binding protein